MALSTPVVAVPDFLNLGHEYGQSGYFSQNCEIYFDRTVGVIDDRDVVWMRLLCQKIATRANAEDGEVGKFWQARFRGRVRQRRFYVRRRARQLMAAAA